MRCSRLTAFGLANFTRVSRVDQDHAVADAGRALDLDLVEVERERPVGDHAARTARTSRGRCARARRCGGRTSSTPRGSGARSARRRAGPGCTARARAPSRRSRACRPRRLARAPAAREQRPLDLVDDGADEVLRVVGLAGDRPHLREHDEAVTFLARDRREQHEVGEREVGERPPARDEPLEVHEIRPAQPGAEPGQVVERAHTTMVTSARRSRVGEQRVADRGERLDVADVVLEAGHAHDDVGDAGRARRAARPRASRRPRSWRTTRRSCAAPARCAPGRRARGSGASASASASGPASSTNAAAAAAPRSGRAG